MFPLRNLAQEKRSGCAQRHLNIARQGLDGMDIKAHRRWEPGSTANLTRVAWPFAQKNEFPHLSHSHRCEP